MGMGKSTLVGIIVGFGMIIAGFLLEKGNIMSLFLLSPALIVFGGTIGALTVSFSLKDVTGMIKLMKEAMADPKQQLNETLDLIVGFATTVKREGILSMEKVLEEDGFKQKHDTLMVRGLTLLMDGLDKQVLKEVLDSELYVFDQIKKREISIFEAAGGFSPTMGIIGTVLGLIQVLSNMGTPEELAKSIAVAFIATMYGIMFANLLFLPIANKLKLRLKLQRLEKEMIIDGILAINDFEGPLVIKERLMPYTAFQEKGGKKGAPAAAAGETKEERPREQESQ
jgi:chemotaxis protein MotA